MFTDLRSVQYESVCRSLSQALSSKLMSHRTTTLLPIVKFCCQPDKHTTITPTFTNDSFQTISRSRVRYAVSRGGNLRGTKPQLRFAINVNSAVALSPIVTSRDEDGDVEHTSPHFVFTQ